MRQQPAIVNTVFSATGRTPSGSAIKVAFRASCIAACAALVLACSGGDPAPPATAQPAPQPAPQPAAQPPVQPSSQQPASQPAGQQPSVPVTQMMFSPSVEDVTAAFENALLKSVMSMPDSPQREQWFTSEYARLQTLRVGQCTRAVIGTPVACRVQFSGHVVDVKLLLTKTGWVLTK